jgi:hypothetical protein
MRAQSRTFSDRNSGQVYAAIENRLFLARFFPRRRWKIALGRSISIKVAKKYKPRKKRSYML